MRKWLDDRKKEAENIVQTEKLQFEEKLHKTKLELETELQASEDQPTPTSSPDNNKGCSSKTSETGHYKVWWTFIDWPRFWGQFAETIDKTNVAPITKFSYLRELFGPSVRPTIEALPFTSEGYNRAKSILQDKYGKESEIVKAYTKEILDPPLVPDANPKAISDFSEKLT